MYIFSANAKAGRSFDDFKPGELVPFIVYINFKDLYGAEQLCQLYLLQQGFSEPHIEKRKLVDARFLTSPAAIEADKALREALESGYSIQVFSAH